MFRRIILASALAISALAVFAFSASAATTQISIGEGHTCALLSDGSVRCFGRNNAGQLGNSTNNGTVIPNPIPATVDLGGKAKQIAAGGIHTCALLIDGTVKCFGYNGYGQLGFTASENPNPTPTAVSLGGAAKQVVADGDHTCVLMTNGSVKCFGYNGEGQLGNATNNGTEVPNPSPATVAIGGIATQIAAGYRHTCALLDDATVKCFGVNYYGQLGNATNIDTNNPNPTPTAVDLGAGAKQIATGGWHTCAVLVDDTVKCFGINYYGQLGNSTNNGSNNSNPTPTAVALGVLAKQVTLGRDHTCALLADNTVKCFGSNQYGQLGNPTNSATNNPTPTPTTVDLGGAASAVAAGYFSTCAILADGTVKCFGQNRYGQLGNSTNNDVDTANPTPAAVAGLEVVDPPATPTPTPALSPAAASFAKPTWKVRRSPKKVKLTTRVRLTGDGVNAASCSGKVELSVKLRGKVKPRSFNLSHISGACVANVNFTIPARIAKRGAKATITLKLIDSTTLTAVPVVSKLKLR